MKKLLFWGPVLTASGYGEHARQLLRAIVDSKQFDVSVESVGWGHTPFISDDDEFVKKIDHLVGKRNAERQMGVQYDVSIQVTIPNEFQKLAAVNIGVTAGIEVDRCSPTWIVKCNEMVDLVIVPSKHSADTLAGVTYRDQNGRDLKLNKPILIVPESFDAGFFNPLLDETLKHIELEPEFNFLSIGLGLDKRIGEDRKNIGNLVKWFCENFAGDKSVGLVLKVGLVNNSGMDYATTLARIRDIKASTGCGEFPRIKLVHGRVTKKELAALYKHPKIGAYLTTTHGEGYGLPIIEAAACGLPVIATNWSGHLDFLHTPDGKRKFVPLDFDLTQIPQSAVWEHVIEPGTKWAAVKPEDFKTKTKKVRLSSATPRQWAKELADSLANTHTAEYIGPKFVQALQEFLGGTQAQPSSRKHTPAEIREKIRAQLQVEPGIKTLLYTMPMSAGDVFISTGVVWALKQKFPDHLIFFATDSKYENILKGDPNIHRVIQFEKWMMDVPFCENIFDEVYTPNLAVQMNTSNWVHGGKGRKLGDEFAAQCDVPFGYYHVHTEEISGLPEKYVVFHPGSGKGQHEARNYRHWKKVIHNLLKSGLTVVTVGQEGDIHFEGCVDLRGKTTYGQLATVIKRASCLVGIDSVTMHMAAALEVPHVAIFGSSYASSTGPVYKDVCTGRLLETKNRFGCEKACYKYQCSVDRENPCLNEIDPKEIVGSVLVKVLQTGAWRVTEISIGKVLGENWDDVSPKIAGYTHVLNPESQGFPYIESIRSMLGFCDEVIVVDGGSKDGSLEKIQKEINDPRVKVLTREWDPTEPGMDGMQKAFGRAMVSVGPDDFLWQQDADEVVHEEDYAKIKKLVERFPSSVDLLHLPVVELWGDSKTVRTDRHSWKWRLSRNNFKITHGINKDARVLDEKTGRTYSKKGMSDGCEYIDIMTSEFIPHKGYYSRELELMRQSDPEGYGKQMNKLFGELPSVFHYSWANIPRKVKNFRDFWDKTWSTLYNEPTPVNRFPDVISEEDVVKKADQLRRLGGEHGKAATFRLERTNPSVMKEWIGRIDAGRLVHHDEEQTRVAQTDAAIAVPVDTERTVQTDAGR